MRVNRLDWLRGLKMLKSIGANEVRLKGDGSFGVSSSDGGNILFGKTVGLGQDVGLMDVAMLEKMLTGLSELDINVEIKDGVMTLSGEKTLFGYRLGQPELIEGFDIAKTTELEAAGLDGASFQFEDVARILSLIKTLGVEKVGFRTDEGKVVVLVGDRKLFYGEIRLEGVVLEKEQVFPAEQLRRVFDVVDSGKVGLFFRKGDKGMLKIATPDFSWYVGALVGG